MILNNGGGVARHRDLEDCLVPIPGTGNLSPCRHGERTILVVSPHPDDDVIGMGGTMRLLVEQGLRVVSLYVTDGGSKGARQHIVLQRRREAIASLKVIGACAAVFFDLKSSHVTEKPCGFAGRIAAILRHLRPKDLYLPCPLERHATHVAVAMAAITALRRMPNYRPRVWGYHVWGSAGDLSGTKAVDISHVVALKRRAIRKHTSQIAARPFDAGMIGRNRYDAVFLHTHQKDAATHVELFTDLRPLLDRRRSLGAALLRLFKQAHPLLFSR